MNVPSTGLNARVLESLAATIDPAVAAFAQTLAEDAGARAVLFYGSNLRTGSLEGVLDYYVLLPGSDESAIWPTVSYHERPHTDARGDVTLRAKVATMCLKTFAKAAKGDFTDTTIWARFVQPSALIWAADEAARSEVSDAISHACKTAARLAVALGPERGTAEDYWRALFRATYQAELRVEKPGRENDILSVNQDHFSGLLPLALDAGGIAPNAEGESLAPDLTPAQRREIQNWWKRKQRMGKPLNLLRLAKATTTFDGAARYAAWKVERHTGIEVEVSPLNDRFPITIGPKLLRALLRHRRNS